MSKITVNLDLIRKYNVAGPRYTSYPPATKFSDEIQWPQVADEIISNNKEARDLSLYFHIPFCQTLCWYCGCNTVITTDQSQSKRYIDYLAAEMRQMSAVMNPERRVVQLHLGGGTPTFLTPDEILTLGELIRNNFKLSPMLEGGVEIDPRRLTRQHLKALRTIGFNRVSLGVQDFNPEVQKAIHRIQPLELTALAMNWARELGFESINVDLIYGLPFQTPQTFEKTVDSVLKLNPDRIALFSYAHVPWMKPAQKILEAKLPTPEQKLDIFKMAVERLTANDEYIYIGMDHFAKPFDNLAIAQRSRTLHRNFQGYSTHGGADIYAFGVSAISQTENGYWQNEKDLVAYYAALDAGKSPIAKGYLITEDDRVRRETIMKVMCNLSLNYLEIERKYNISFTSYFAREIESLHALEKDGLIRFTALGFEVTPAGRLLIRNIAMRFDGYYSKEGEKRFSRTI